MYALVTSETWPYSLWSDPTKKIPLLSISAWLTSLLLFILGSLYNKKITQLQKPNPETAQCASVHQTQASPFTNDNCQTHWGIHAGIIVHIVQKLLLYVDFVESDLACDTDSVAVTNLNLLQTMACVSRSCGGSRGWHLPNLSVGGSCCIFWNPSQTDSARSASVFVRHSNSSIDTSLAIKYLDRSPPEFDTT